MLRLVGQRPEDRLSLSARNKLVWGKLAEIPRMEGACLSGQDEGLGWARDRNFYTHTRVWSGQAELQPAVCGCSGLMSGALRVPGCPQDRGEAAIAAAKSLAAFPEWMGPMGTERTGLGRSIVA